MDNVRRTLHALREAVPVMAAEQQALPTASVFRPSPMWDSLRGFFDFVYDLSDHSLLKIRLHTSLMTGDPWFANMPYASLGDDAAKLRLVPTVQKYHDLTRDIPGRFWTSEPVTTGEIESVGVRYHGRLVSDDIIRYQRCISNLYRGGVFGMLDALGTRPIIAEIGGGYGGLAHQITRTLDRPAAYLIFDLPDMLYWSAAFLLVNNADRRFYIYPGAGRDHASLAEICASHDFVFFPNYAFERLAEVPEIHLFLNTLSFQEMTDPQVEVYARGGAARLRGALYSENRSRHPNNPDLAVTVDDILARYFALTPDPEVWRRLYPNANTFANPQFTWQLFPYLGHARTDQARFARVDRVMHLQDRRVDV